MSSSMHRHGLHVHSALRMPDQHGVNARYVGIGRFAIKGFISHLHCLVKKGFMVHGWIVSRLSLYGHSYFPRGS